jgi:hypothetical protein
MAYFSNGTEGMAFDYQCSICKYGDDHCPIALVQLEFNYSVCNNATAQGILNMLIRNDGTCEMFKEFEKDFSKKIEEKQSPSLFDICFPNEK